MELEFDFNSGDSSTVFTNNINYLKKVVEDAFKSEGRKEPIQSIKILGKANQYIAVSVNYGGFARVRSRVMYRAKNQTHSKIIFPEWTGTSNSEWVKNTFSHTKGKWSWNE